MKVVLKLAAFASLALAQGYVYNDTTGAFTCTVSNGVFCLGGNIILRCTGTSGQPGNCDDNLAGEPPLGVNSAACYSQGDVNSEVAACSKNCVVYGGSGNINGTFAEPGCVPTYTASAPTASATSPSGSSAYTATFTNTSSVSNGSATTVVASHTADTTSLPSSIILATGGAGGPGGAGSIGGVANSTNSTTVPTDQSGGSGGDSADTATNTPASPTSYLTSGLTVSNTATIKSGSALAALGLVFVYFL